MGRTARAAVALAVAPGLALLALPLQSYAAEEVSRPLTVPGTGQSDQVTFTGAAPPGVTGIAGCDTGAPRDSHEVELAVPAGSLDGVSATLTFEIAWDNAGNDLVLEVLGPDGTLAGSSDGGSPQETVVLTELAAGTYTVVVCGFASATTQAYDGTVTVAVSEPAPPAGPTVERGLEFGASLVTDPQRSQGESAAFADGEGVLYSCGTNGASNGTDHGSVSVDGGETWRPLGTAPFGETGTVQGGGDCAIATSQDPNEQGNRQLAFIGLGPLTGFSTFTSPDNGRTLVRSPDQNGIEKFNQQSLVDRQWLVFTDEDTVFLNYNAALVSAGAQGQVVQRSDDGGLTYAAPFSVATDGSRLGQIRAIPEDTIEGVDDDVVYFPYNSGTKVKLALSLDGGETWSQCLAVDAGIDPTAGFVAADHDADGNIYVTYAEKGGGRDTYLVGLRAADVPKCRGPNPVAQSAENNVNPGFTDKIRLNREGIETVVMPWVAAGGEGGRAAVAYYGTPTVGDPNLGDFKATWHVYVSQVLDVFADEPEVDQARATTHPSHYDSICLNGLQCDVDMGDRSLVDYFTTAYDPTTGRIVVVYNQAAKRPDDPEGRIASPVSLIQRAGQSNGGGTVALGPPVVRTSTTDKEGDALARWTTSDSVLGSPALPQPSPEVPALDLLDVQVGPQLDLATGEQVAGGGFTVEMTYADLSDAALQQALTAGPGTSLVYLFRFFDGYQPGGATAHYEPATGGWRFGYNDYQTTPVNPQGNVVTYKGDEAAIQGTVDQEAGVIRLSVPADLVEALAGPQGDGERPAEVPAAEGDRVYDASAWTFINPVPNSTLVQSYMFQADNTAAFDFVLGAGATGGTDGTGGAGTGGAGGGSGGTGGSGTGTGAGRLAATGGLPLLGLAALLIAGGAAAALRRRTAG